MSNIKTDNDQQDKSIDPKLSNTLNESLQALKTYNPMKYYTLNKYVDVMDSYSSWRISKIIEIKDDIAIINFDGWSSKWNEAIRLTGNKIAPFKKHTPPYTGGQKQAVRDFDFEKSSYKSLVIEAIREMETLINSKFLTGKPHAITQYIRGDLYILVDAVLTIGTNIKNPSDLKLIVEFLETFIQFFVKFLEVIPSLMKEYIEGRAINPMLYLVNDKIAVVSCFPEMVDTMSKLFGGVPRCLKLFQMHGHPFKKIFGVYQGTEFAIKPQSTVYATKPRDKYSSHHNQIVNNINYFGSLSGFEKLFSLLKWEIKLSNDSKNKDSNDKDKDNILRLPIYLLKLILPMIIPISSLMSSSFKNNFFKDFKNIFFDRIDKMTQREMKDNDSYQALTLIRESLSIFEEYYKREAYQFIEQAEFEFTLKMLKCPFLEKKIKALNEFKDFFDRIDTDIDIKQLGDKRRFLYLNKDKLKNLILQKKIIEYLLEDIFHVEILKRSTVIMKFLANQNSFTNDHLNILWRSCENKHEALVRVVYEAITDISSYLSIESLDYLFSKFLLIPVEKYDEMTITLIKDFTLNAMQVVSSSMTNSYFVSKKKQTRYDFYGLKLLWDAIQDNSKLELQWVTQTFTAIATLIKNSNFKTEKDKYLNLCFDNLKKGNSVPQSLLLSLHILSTYAGQINFLGGSLEDILNKYNKEYNFFECLVIDFERYMTNVTDIMETLKTKGQIPENKGAYIFVGKYAHQQNIDHRLLFLENMINHLKRTDKEFTFDHIKRLWNCLIKNAVTEVEQTSFLNWLIKLKDPSSTSKTKVYLFGEHLLKALFVNVLCDKLQMDNYIKLTPEIFKCWEKLFEIINEKEGVLECYRNTIKINKYDQLIGLEMLWQIIINNKNDKVIKNVKALLATIHFKIQTSNSEMKLKIWQNFFDRCIELLKQYTEDSTVVSNVISVLNIFILNIDGRKFIGNDSKPSHEYLSFIIGFKNDEQKKTIVLPANSTFLYLRRRIAEEFNIGVNDFDITLLNGTKITPEGEEEYTMSQIVHLKDKDKEKDIIITPKISTSYGNINIKEKFKLLIVNNQNTMDIFFQLLSTFNIKIANDVWELLNFLPVNKRLKDEIQKLNFETEEAWSKILDSKCVQKLQYCLQILFEFINTNNNNNGNDSNEAKDWCIKFIQKKGLLASIKIFFEYKITELSQHIFQTKCFSTLVKLLDHFLQKYPRSFYQYFDNENKLISDIIQKILMCITIIARQTCLDLVIDDDGEDESHMLEAYRELIQDLFGLLNTTLKGYPLLIEQVFTYPDLIDMLQKGLIESKDISMRSDIANNVISLVESMNVLVADQKIEKPHLFFLSLFLDNFLKSINTHRDKCSHFFDVIEHIYQNSTMDELETSKIDFKALFENLIQEIIKIEPFESTQADADHLLQGLLRFVNTLLQKNTKLKDDPILKSTNFIEKILHSCLFEIPEAGIQYTDMIIPPKCKSLDSRKAAFQLLGTLCSSQNDNLKQAVDYLKNPLLSNFWRTSNYSDWFIHSSVAERGKAGYVGLKNLGCTCYMNSLIQQFFMIPEFRDTLLATEDYVNNTDPEDNVLYQLQLIFAALKMSQRQYFDPRGFCYSFKNYEGKPINVLEQMDVDEFFNNLLDKVENLLKSSKNEAIIKRVFGGILSNELICKGCPHYSEREEPFLAISLQVKNKKNINESLASFVQGEMLEGDNAYLCERCDKKVPTLKRVCIKKLPNILMIALKRFEFDFDTMQKYKVNDYCEFPTKLNMQQYTQMYLKKNEKIKKTESNTDNNNQDDEESEIEYPQEYYEYTLTGIVIHMGTAESGHYYSIIKDKNGNWMEFNDNVVRGFDIRDLAQEAFGGEEKFNLSNLSSTFSKGLKERTRNAYLLFYQRTTYFDLNGQQINSLVLSRPEDNHNGNGNGNKKDLISNRILNEIKEDNFKFHMTKMIFDKEYLDFVYCILTDLDNTENLEMENKLEAAKFCVLFLITVPLRAKDRNNLASFLKKVKSLLRKSLKLSAWFLNAFKNPKIIKEFLISCPVKDMKYFIIGLLRIATENEISYSSKLDYPTFIIQSKIPKLIDSLIYSIHENKEQLKMLDKIFDFLMILSLSDSPHIRLYMLKTKLISKIFSYINDIKSSSSSSLSTFNNKDMMITSQQQIDNDVVYDLGEPTEIINKKNEMIKSMCDILEKKKEKLNLENMNVNYNGLIVMLSKLVLSINVNQQSTMLLSASSSSNLLSQQQQQQQTLFLPAITTATNTMTTSSSTSIDKATKYLPYILDEDEKAYIFNNPMLLDKLMTESTSKKSKCYLSNMLAHLSYKNLEFTNVMFSLIEKGLDDKDELQLNIYLQTLDKLMNLQDDYQSQRVSKGVKILVKSIQQNTLYYIYTEICFDYLVKICSKNALVLKSISEDKNFIKTMDQWIREHSDLANSISNSKIKILRKREAKFSVPILQQNKGKLISKAEYRLSKLDRINKNDNDGLEPYYDTDDDYSEHKYEIEEKLDYFSDQCGAWISAIVLEDLEEMLNIKCMKDQSIWTVWVYSDSDKLGPHMKIQMHTKYDVDFYR